VRNARWNILTGGTRQVRQEQLGNMHALVVQLDRLLRDPFLETMTIQYMDGHRLHIKSTNINTGFFD
jgi:hypothetical protein